MNFKILSKFYNIISLYLFKTYIVAELQSNNNIISNSFVCIVKKTIYEKTGNYIIDTQLFYIHT